MSNRTSRITLDSNLSVNNAKKLQSRLINCASKGVDVCIHADKVTEMDLSALQQLCAMVKQVREDGRSVSWRKPSQRVVEVAELTGLSAALGLDT